MVKDGQSDDREPPGGGAASTDNEEPPGRHGLERLIGQIRRIEAARDPVTLEDVLLQIGRRSFGAILLFAGLIVLVPLIGDIPGVPTLAALLVAITAVQLLVGRIYFWLPDFLLKRSIQRNRLDRALDRLDGPARTIDKLVRPRLQFLTSPAVTRLVAGVSLGVAMVMPVLELIPFSANLAGIALSAFGLSLIARDGLFALVSLVVAGSAFGLVGYWLATL